MKQLILVVFAFILSASSNIFAQFVPSPVIDQEIRDGSSIRRRSIELERVKREANTPIFQETLEEQKIKFAQIKEDFEGLQKLEESIVKTYTTGKTINYSKIAEFAAEMTKKGMRLDENLFNSKSDKIAEELTKKEKSPKQKSVKALIIELDTALGVFVGSPIFKNTNVVDTKVAEKSRLDLEKLMKLSGLLAIEATKMK